MFELNKIEKLTPWNVNIAYLLSSFLSEMDKEGKTDFRASGVALDSSALIYLMKSKLLLTLQEPPTLSKAAGDFVPPPLFLPLRHELTSTTVQNLYEAIKEMIKSEEMLHVGRVAPHPIILQPIPDLMPQFDRFIAELELQMDKLYSLLNEKVKGAGIIDFCTFTKGMTRIEAIRIVIYLLFLAQNGKVILWQNEQTEELYIAVGNFKIGKTENSGN